MLKGIMHHCSLQYNVSSYTTLLAGRKEKQKHKNRRIHMLFTMSVRHCLLLVCKVEHATITSAAAAAA